MDSCAGRSSFRVEVGGGDIAAGAAGADFFFSALTACIETGISCFFRKGSGFIADFAGVGGVSCRSAGKAGRDFSSSRTGEDGSCRIDSIGTITGVFFLIG